MRSRAVRLAALFITLATGAVSAPVAACGLEGGLGDSIGAAHPGSLEVAFAAYDAIKAGLLIPDVALGAALAHDRGDERLQMLAASLPVLDGAVPIAVLLIEPGVWTRLTPKAGTWVVTEHADRPDTCDFTLVASELAVRDLTHGRLTAREALARGLLSVNGHAPLVAALTQAYPDAPPSVAQR